MLCQSGVLLVVCICPLASIAMSQCPAGCCCLQPGLLVLCESLGLKTLPRSVPHSTAILSVSKNQLCNVDHQFGPFTSLQELSLSHNLLSRFPRGLPPILEALFLQENRITYITSGALRKLQNLTRLDLKDNHIRNIQPGALQDLEKLQVLILKGNKLTSVPPNLPPSLTHLDLSANCISALDPSSLSPLVNLQVLKISSNFLHSIPDRFFDKLAHLQSLDLTNNLWVCESDVLYLFRWMLSGRLKRTSTDLVCTQPVHLVHRLLLNLSITAISKTLQQKTLNGEHLPEAQNTFETVTTTQVLDEHYYLNTLTFEECVSLNGTQSGTVSYLKTTQSPYSQMNTTHPAGTRPLSSTNSSNPHSWTQHNSVATWLLAFLCVLSLLLILLVFMVLKKMLHRQQRVAPPGSG